MEKKIPVPFQGDSSKKLRTIITFFTCLVLVLVSLFCLCGTTSYGYQYYEINNNGRYTITYSQKADNIETTIKELLNQLEKEGYYIVSSELDKDIFCKKTMIKTVEKDKEENNNRLKDIIKESLKVDILLSKLIVLDTNYYFKTEEECKSFAKKLGVDYKIEDTIGDYKLISKENELQELEKKCKEIVAERERKKRQQEEANKKAAVAITSRSGTRENFTGTAAPITNYIYISSPFGWRWGRMHNGVDFAANYGTNIYAWKAGKVTYAGWSGGYGNFVVVEHSDGTVSRYGHCSSITVSLNQWVSTGQIIAKVGSTGNSTGNHLHFEIKVNGSFVNPLNYL